MARDRKRIAEINVVPYIDVMLVLLIIFMVTAPLLTQGVKVDLPNAPSKPLDGDDLEPLVVSIKGDGTLFINLERDKDKSLSVEEINKKVSAVLRRKPDTPVMVWGDTDVPYGKVVSLMTSLQNAGAPSVGLVTEPGPLN